MNLIMLLILTYELQYQITNELVASNFFSNKQYYDFDV